MTVRGCNITRTTELQSVLLHGHADRIGEGAWWTFQVEVPRSCSVSVPLHSVRLEGRPGQARAARRRHRTQHRLGARLRGGRINPPASSWPAWPIPSASRSPPCSPRRPGGWHRDRRRRVALGTLPTRWPGCSSAPPAPPGADGAPDPPRSRARVAAVLRAGVVDVGDPTARGRPGRAPPQITPPPSRTIRPNGTTGVAADTYSAGTLERWDAPARTSPRWATVPVPRPGTGGRDAGRVAGRP